MKLLADISLLIFIFHEIYHKNFDVFSYLGHDRDYHTFHKGVQKGGLFLILLNYIADTIFNHDKRKFF